MINLKLLFISGIKGNCLCLYQNHHGCYRSLPHGFWGGVLNILTQEMCHKERDEKVRLVLSHTLIHTHAHTHTQTDSLTW